MERQIVIKNVKNAGIQLLVVFAALTGATLISLGIRDINMPAINAVVVYVLSVLLVARFTRGYFFGVLASIIGIMCYNFFFTEPYYTLNVYHNSDIITIAVMLSASILTSTLTSKLLRSTKLAKEREAQTNMLFQITSSLAKASGVSDVAAVSVQSISNLLDSDVWCILTANRDQKILLYQANSGARHVQTREIEHAQIEEYTAGKTVIPIGNQSTEYGILCLSEQTTSDHPIQEGLVRAIVMQILIAMEREKYSEEKKQVKIEMEHEKFRGNLLRAISHDLRTPLTGISGTAEFLMLHLEKEEDKNQAAGIFEEANWLSQMVENILSLTKIEDGRLTLRKQMEAVEEIIGEAVKHANKVAGGRHITSDIPDEVLFVSMDGKLILQVLINLIDNAIKHTSQDGTILIQVKKEPLRVWFCVSDNGTGIRQNDFPHLFDAFFVSKNANNMARDGVGLGLSIVKAIVQAHGGRVLAENNPDGGAMFRFYLPLNKGDDDE